MENGKSSSQYKSRKFSRNSKSSLRNSVRKSKNKGKTLRNSRLRQSAKKEKAITPDELLKQNSVEEELSESINKSETTFTQQESDNFEDDSRELKEIKEEKVIQKRKSSVKRNNGKLHQNKRMRKSQSGKKEAVDKLRRSCYGREGNGLKLGIRVGDFDLEGSQNESKLYIKSLENKLQELVESGEYLKADMVYKEMKKAKSRFSKVVIKNIKKELSQGEKMLNETLIEEEKELQNKFDELKQRILDDFEEQVSELEKKSTEEEQRTIDNFNQTEEKEHEKHFKKSVHLLEMEEQIRGLIKNREYRAAETLKHKITKKMDEEVIQYRENEEAKLDKILKVIAQKKDLEMQSVEHRLNSALNELKIAFREQKESLKKRQSTLKRNFKNKELLKLNKVNMGRENRGKVEKFRSEILRKEPYKNNKFRKTILNKENCIGK